MGAWSERTSADVSSLLVEFGRLLKGAWFYGSADAATKSLAERAHRAWQADLDRAGPLGLRLTASGFRAEGIRESIGTTHLGELATALERAGIENLRFDDALSADSLLAFAVSLPQPLETANSPPGPRQGIAVNGTSLPPAAEDVVRASEDREPVRTSLGASLLGGRSEHDDRKPSIDEEPLEAPPSSPVAAQFVHALRELHGCADDGEYIRLVPQVAQAARELGEAGEASEAYRAILVLADHTVGQGARSTALSRVAHGALRELATDDRLADLIQRASSRDATSVHAARVLLLLGESAAQAILQRLDADPEGPRAGQLLGLLIALGERAAPSLSRAMDSGREAHARLAIKIAGELRCPALADSLGAVLCDGVPKLRKDAAEALVEMGNSAALDALLAALASDQERVGEVAAYSLGALGAPRTLPHLAAQLERARARRQWRCALEILRSIGQFVEGDPETSKALVRWVQSGGPPWSRPNLELKLEAITTLGRLSGPAPREALRRIAAALPHLPRRLRDRAQRILERRA